MIPTNSSYYSRRKIEKKRVVSLWKLNKLYTAEFVDSHFNLCGCGYHNDHVDVDALAVDTVDVHDDPVPLYLGYYDWGSLYLVICVSDFDNPYFCIDIFVNGVGCETYFVKPFLM
jgi:hypothetical protein